MKNVRSSTGAAISEGRRQIVSIPRVVFVLASMSEWRFGSKIVETTKVIAIEIGALVCTDRPETD